MTFGLEAPRTQDGTVGSVSGHPWWPPASRKRLFVAGYLDYLIVGVPLALAVHLITSQWQEMQRASWPIRMAFFLTLEFVLMKKTQWSPGMRAMGIVAFRRSPFERPNDPRESRPAYLVEPAIFHRERWWTILLGVLLILDGARVAVRWTLWHAPMPLMGMQPGETAAILIRIVTGALEIVAGAGVLRLSRPGVALGAGVLGFQIVSWLTSWSLLPGWAAREVLARRAAAGAAPRQGEIAFMQSFAPVVMVAGGLLVMGWLVLAGWRVRRANQPGAGSFPGE
jgi:hypothetical protein